MRVLLPTMLLVAACGPAGQVSDSPCRQGFSRAPDGHCYPPRTDPEPPDATAVIDALPACILDKPDGRVDLEAGCAEPACAGDTYGEIAGHLGDGDCAVASWSSQEQYCSFDLGIQGLFADLDEDGLPDDDARTDWIRLLPDYPYATTDGLGMGTSARCWTEALGTPSQVWFVDAAGSLVLDGMSWDDYGLEVHDWDGKHDGIVDTAYLFGAP